MINRDEPGIAQCLMCGRHSINSLRLLLCQVSHTELEVVLRKRALFPNPLFSQHQTTILGHLLPLLAHSELMIFSTRATMTRQPSYLVLHRLLFPLDSSVSLHINPYFISSCSFYAVIPIVQKSFGCSACRPALARAPAIRAYGQSRCYKTRRKSQSL